MTKKQRYNAALRTKKDAWVDVAKVESVERERYVCWRAAWLFARSMRWEARIASQAWDAWMAWRAARSDLTQAEKKAVTASISAGRVGVAIDIKLNLHRYLLP